MTSTELDFVHAFRRAEAKDCVVECLGKECRLEGASLFAYVVMPHHVHFVARPRANQTISGLMQKLKPRIGSQVSKLLSAAELEPFNQQRGLNGNTFWQRSFRAIEIRDEEMLWQKIAYVNANPVRAEDVERAEEYRWSSARLVLTGHLDLQSGLEYGAVADSLTT